MLCDNCARTCEIGKQTVDNLVIHTSKVSIPLECGIELLKRLVTFIL